ncbi:hypothetical protein DBW61_02460 [bacterium]|nr:MAG: hypothetical protein DBW61_02460 [bacterium]
MLHKYIIICILILFGTGCKDANQIELESMIDEFNHLKNNKLIEKNKLQDLKTIFENLSYSSNHKVRISALYYLSEISLIENKINEAYDFINEAYTTNHADSIYKQLHILKNLLKPKDTTNNNKTNNIEFENIFNIGRSQIKKMYADKNYLNAENQTLALIEMISSLKEEGEIKIELAQLYQDLAIFCSQQNKIDEAKKYIEKAIKLNSTSESLEIEKLINKK